MMRWRWLEQAFMNQAIQYNTNLSTCYIKLKIIMAHQFTDLRSLCKISNKISDARIEELQK